MFWGEVDAVVNAADVYREAFNSAQKQSPCRFYWWGSENLSHLIVFKALIRLILDFWSHNYSTYFWPRFCILSVYIHLWAECET